jgi:hypothetical protein
MVRSVWLRRAGPGIVAIGAIALLASTALGARDRPWDPPDCADVRGGSASRAPVVPDAATEGAGRAPWFRLDPVLDGNGALTGQRLIVGRPGGSVQRMALPAESFAAGPFGAVLLVGTDDGSRSRLLAVDALDGCATELAVSRDVVRRATISPDGASLVEFRVDRRTRADLGTWRRSLAGPARRAAVRILPPIEPDPRFGRTFATELRWTDDGTLLVESCGEVACRTRAVGPAGAADIVIDEPALGPALGLVDGRLVSYLACRGLPCPIVVTDPATGRRRTVVDASGPAVLTATTAGVRLVHVRDDGHGRILRAVALDGSETLDLGALPDGLGLLTDPAAAHAAVPLPPGWVLLAPDGRPAPDRAATAAILRNALDGRSASFEEVLP